jgi:hypothetical protein
MLWSWLNGWLTENVLTLVVLASFFAALAGYAGHREALIARGEAAKANEAAEQARERAAVANKAAAEATLALEKFKAGRSLSTQQRAAVVSKIRSFAGQEYILSASSDQESLRFVRVLDSVLAEAGWIKRPNPSQVKTADGEVGISAAPESGVRVQIAATSQNDLQLVMRARALADALAAVGISSMPAAVREEELERSPKWIQVRVGSKPQ